MKRIHLLMLSFLIVIGLKGQTVEAGFGAGLSLYYGDLTPEGFTNAIQNTNLAFNASGRLTLPSRVSFKLGALFTQFSGDSENTGRGKDRAFNFQTDLVELSLTAEWSFIRLGSSRYGAIYPYIYAGIGGFYFNPKTNFEGDLIDLQPLGTEGQGLPGYGSKYELIQPLIPVGGGFRMAIDDFGTIGLEIGARKLFTDYLDDLSGTEINYQDLLQGNGELAARISNPGVDPQDSNLSQVNYKRGNFPTDWYYITTVSISIPLFTITKSGVKSGGLGCPRF